MPDAESARVLRPDWRQARASAYEAGAQVAARPLPIRDCLGDQLAETLITGRGLPHYASAAMDGWAVAGSPPWIVVEHEPGMRLFPGQAAPIMTGALVPQGAYAVLRSESGVQAADQDGLEQVRLSATAAPGEPRRSQHIRQVGEEAPAGTVLVEPGARLNPAHLALAAAVGRDTLSVSGHVRAALVYSGDEVITSGEPGPGQVRDAFGVHLAATVGMLGVRVTGEQWLSDCRRTTVQALDQPAELIITTGGTGASQADHLRPALAELGADLIIDGIALRPGGPGLLARLPDGVFVAGLPGNPLAALVDLAILVQPLVRALRGLSLPEPAELPAGAPAEPFHGSTRAGPYREVFGMASAQGPSGAGMLSALTDADGLMFTPPHGLRLGENVPTLSLPWQPGQS